MRFFYLKTCDSCRKALRALKERGVTPDLVDLRGTLDPADLDAMVDAFGDAVVNKRSTTWRGLDEAERALPARELIAEHPTLIKRPVIQHEGRWYQGIAQI